MQTPFPRQGIWFGPGQASPVIAGMQREKEREGESVCEREGECVCVQERDIERVG